jgi:3-dehydroquinate dehydratase-1
MSLARPLKLARVTLDVERGPLACAPLVGRDEAALRAELEQVLATRPDLLEWRIDHFAPIADTARVLAFARELRASAGALPIVLTRRSVREGGPPIALDEDAVFDLHEAVCRGGHVDLVDVETSCEPHRWARARDLARTSGVRMIGSFHDFVRTPPRAELVARFAAMQAGGADIAKVAVMPQDLHDVLTLLEATLEAREKLDLPLISMSMGPLGALTRLCGWVFGSSVSFVVGAEASAPGQLPIADLRAAVDVLHRALSRR